MSFRKSSSETPETTEPSTSSALQTPSQPGQTQGKGRPTRTRREAEAARRRPLVVSDRKEARRRDRARAQEARMKAHNALMTGDERDMPFQHRGPGRRFVRDVVDARWNVAELFMPGALIFMLIAFVLPLFRPQLATTVSGIIIIVLWGGIALCVLDAFLLRHQLRKRLQEKFGEVEKGLVGYGIMRQIQIRRWRLPRPQVKHGGSPR